MSQENLKQSLSALMDNEADELELHRVLQASNDAQLREQWSRYHMARAAMHNESWQPQTDLSAQIMAAIEAEPALPAAQHDTFKTAAPKRKATSSPWFARVAVAASVTLAVLAGVRFYNYDALQQETVLAQSEQRLPATTQTQSPAVLASYSAQGDAALVAQAVSGQDAWYDSRLPSYLRQHAQQSSISQTDVGLPYARAASLEGQ